MRHFRDVDATAKWMKTCVQEEMIVEALASSVIAEIQAQADHIATLEIEISKRGSEIRDLTREAADLYNQVEEKNACISGMEKELINRGLHSSAIRMIKENAGLLNK